MINLVRYINEKNYDCAISFFSTFKTGLQLWKSNIKKRYAPSTKLAQFFITKNLSKIDQQKILNMSIIMNYIFSGR